MRRSIGQTRTTLGRRIEVADLLSFFTVLVIACSSAIATSLQIAECRWEQAAKAAFYARMPALVVVEPMFNFVKREQLITAAALGLLIVVVWMMFTRWSLYAMRLINRQTRSRSAAFDSAAQLRAIQESLKRGADARQSPLWPADPVKGDKPRVPEYQPDLELGNLSLEYADFEYMDAKELRTLARTSFRLAAGPVSSRLAES